MAEGQTGIGAVWTSLTGYVASAWAWATSLLLSRLILLGALVVFLLEVVPRWAPPVYPFTTYGEIYVDSPEVYTRERLVNDRYDQDFWLRTKLRELDGAENLISRREMRQVDASANTDGAQAPENGGGPPEPLPAELTFRDELAVQNDIRTDLRQKILENLLDDRHDLSGNSLYGFKFDTTVVAGANTQSSAFVRMRLRTNSFRELRLIDDNTKEERGATVDDFLYASMDPDHPMRGRYKEYEDLYQELSRNVESRLNNNVATSFNSKPVPNCTSRQVDLRTRAVLANVLSVNSNEVVITGRQFSAQMAPIDKSAADESAAETEAAAKPSKDDAVPATPKVSDEALAQTAEDLSPPASSYNVELGAPWETLFNIEVIPGAGRECLRQMQFVLHQLFEVEFLFRRVGTAPVSMPDWAKTIGLQARRAISPEIYLARIRQGDTAIERQAAGSVLEVQLPRFFYSDFLDLADTTPNTSEGHVRKLCNPMLQLTLEDCPEGQEYYALSLNVGALNLIKRLSLQDAYSYAVLPDSRATGIVSGSDTSLSAGVQGGGWLGQLGIGSSTRQSATESSVVGFSDSSVATSAEGSVEFGWVIDMSLEDGHMKSDQMALISVPASVSELEFTVTRGWLDRHGDPVEEEESYVISAALPPDFEAFETIIFDASDSVRRQPVILQDKRREDGISQLHKVFVCRENRILIPGRRLWRSTEVTLGGYQADRIVVMPNMEGIVAIFTELPRELASDIDGREREAVNDLDDAPRGALDLRVWTSEGVVLDESRRYVPVMPAHMAAGLKPGSCDAIDPKTE